MSKAFDNNKYHSKKFPFFQITTLRGNVIFIDIIKVDIIVALNIAVFKKSNVSNISLLSISRINMTQAHDHWYVIFWVGLRECVTLYVLG